MLGASTRQAQPRLRRPDLLPTPPNPRPLPSLPRPRRRVGVVRALRLGLYHTVLVAAMVPSCSLFGGVLAPTQAAMLASLAMKAVSGTNAFTGCLIIVNAAAPPDALGAVNGAGQSLASLVRALGPALGGLGWAWSHALAPALPTWMPHQYLPFVFIALTALGTDLVYRGMRMPEADGSSGGEAAERGDADRG